MTDFSNDQDDAQNAKTDMTASEATDDTNDPQTGVQDADAAGTGDADNPNREAAKFRRRLRETETERDQLRDRVESLQRKEVERVAAERLDRPSDLWLTGTELGELVDDDGTVDAERVDATVDAVLADRPGWQRRTPPVYDGGARKATQPVPTWQQMLQGGQKR